MSATGILEAMIQGLSHLVSPNVCRICGQTLITGERLMCLSCNIALPRTNVHRYSFNEIHRRLGHHHEVDRAAGWFSYTKNTPYAHMLVDAKYNRMPKIDYTLGQICATELAAENFFDGIELLVPMPMYWLKRLLRGYNQAEEICRGISSVTSIPWCDALKAKHHGIQARHNKAQRHQSVADTMSVKRMEEIKGKSVLLVDDIITSGASCTEAIRAISTAQPSTINVLSLGLTKAAQ